MNCESFNKYLDNYEGTDEEIREEMNKHAEKCENCRKEMEFMLSIRETIKSLPKIEPPADFMDKLNLRIDAEEKKKYSFGMRVRRSIGANWRQYAAAAACFALVAVITANGRTLVDKMNGSDGGVVQDETRVSDTGNAEVPSVPVETPDTADEPEVKTDTETAQTAVNTAENKTETKTAAQTANPVKTPSAKRQTSTNTVKTVSTARPAAEETTPAPAETSVDAQPVQEQESKPSAQSDDYEAAPLSLDEPESSGYSMRRSADGYNLREIKGGDIAKGRYYKLDRDGNPIEDEEPKAIGNIKISPSDADKAMDVIRQYSYDAGRDLYMTDSTALSVMLSCLSQKGIKYSNYTPVYEGDITFKLVIG